MDSDTIAIIVAALFAVSEALALIPAVKANGVFQAIFEVLKSLAGRK